MKAWMYTHAPSHRDTLWETPLGNSITVQTSWTMPLQTKEKEREEGERVERKRTITLIWFWNYNHYYKRRQNWHIGLKNVLNSQVWWHICVHDLSSVFDQDASRYLLSEHCTHTHVCPTWQKVKKKTNKKWANYQVYFGITNFIWEKRTGICL